MRSVITKSIRAGFIFSFVFLLSQGVVSAQSDSTALDRIAKELRENPALDARSLFLPAIHLYKQNGDAYHECKGWFYLASFIPGSAESNPYRLECYQKYYDLASAHHYDQLKWDALRNIADIHLQNHQLDLAEAELQEIIKPGNHASHANLLLTYDLLSGLYSLKVDYKKALDYALRNQRMMQPADTANAVTFYGRLFTIFRHLNEPSESLIWAMKAYECAIRNQQWILASNASTAVTSTLIALGKPQDALVFLSRSAGEIRLVTPQTQRNYLAQRASCYVALGQYDMAERSFADTEALLKANEKEFSNHDKAATANRIGQFYLTTERPRLARRYFVQALMYYQLLGDVNYIKDVYLLIFKADSALGDFQSAVVFLQKSNVIKDSVFDATTRQQIKTLQIAFETEQKNKDIKELQGQAKIQQMTLQHSESTRNWIILGSLLLCIAVIILYRQVKMTRRANGLITHNNVALQRLVKEKEWLLKEVHHRVKNNLHTVISLLESQARYLESDALTAIEASQHRIFAMCLIHQKLYNSDNVESIDMAAYVRELAVNLEKSYGVSGQVNFNLQVAPIVLDVSRAVSLGLIINEAITNSLKHAFPAGGMGNIFISLRCDDCAVVLEVADNGIGMPDAVCAQGSGTLGIALMKGLSADIEATIRFETRNGVRVIVSFTTDPQFIPERNPMTIAS